MEKFSYLNRDNLEFIEAQYQSFLQNPGSVQSDWRLFFEGVEFAKGVPETGSISTELAVLDLVRAYREEGHFQSDLNPLETGPRNSDRLSLARFGLKESDLNQTYFSPTLLGLDRKSVV